MSRLRRPLLLSVVALCLPSLQVFAEGPFEPEESLKHLTVAEGLEVTLWAAEPMVRNPAVMDIDSRGRVWVAEGVNYRGWKDLEPEGDRILILEDTDGDGRADSSKVFYQGKDIDNALGLCVMGNRVAVSRSPNVFVFTDENGDDVADKKEVLFAGLSGEQHDHGVHSVVFGPDGKFYFNAGNEGRQLLHADGSPVIDRAGNKVDVSDSPYQEGMVFRCNPDGSEFETLAWNFRNNYEVCVDSFGTLWQSDNDDDGNKGVRINYVMEFGNFGYKDELTRAGWSTPRLNLEAEIPLRHWHQNDPGVVPNLLQTGAGSPTGILVYEGELLPEVFRNQVIHCDAGPNVVRAYPVTPKGAGYEARIVNLLHSQTDTWFRPADVCVAPDGSVFVADWYDPGVGGHAMGDNTPGAIRGRLYRLAPPGHKGVSPKLDLQSADGCVAALASPNLATRFLAWKHLHELQAEAEEALLGLWKGKNARLRARALHLLVRIEGRAERYLEAALRDKDPDIRLTALRITRSLGLDVIGAVRRLVKDPSPRVRRECAIALRHSDSPFAPSLWAELAKRHDGGDRWYLEALGIGAEGRWDACLSAWFEEVGEKWNTPGGRDILWRARCAAAPEYLERIIADPATDSTASLRYLRALQFQPERRKQAAFTALFKRSKETLGEDPKWTRIGRELLTRASDFKFDPSEIPDVYVRELADASVGTENLAEIVNRFNLRDRNEQLWAFILAAVSQDSPSRGVITRALRAMADHGGEEAILAGIKAAEPSQGERVADILGNLHDEKGRALLSAIALDMSLPLNVRQGAVIGMGHSQGASIMLINLAKEGKLPEDLKTAARERLVRVSTEWSEVHQELDTLLPAPTS
ncbi:MAG: dehydrogenase, partial [Candidatus Omnitrophica bacterium]|nr:dehydrogenase [Candidatus Omnitrophota bacterium]